MSYWKSANGDSRGKPSAAVLACILMAVAGTAVPAWAEVPISACGFQITAPGTYIVTADLNCSPLENGIEIRASQVAVKLNGHIITGVGSGGFRRGILVFSPAGRLNHVTIQGPGFIRGFLQGIEIAQADYSQVALVTSARNAHGIYATDCTYLTVGSNVLVGNGGEGLQFHCSNSAIMYNDASGNGIGGGASGIFIGGPANTVNNNTANGNSANGIEIAGKNSRVYSNVTNGNAFSGIFVYTGVGATGNQIFHNTSSVGNGDVDLADTDVACDSNVWSDNVSFTRRPASCVR